MTLPKVKLYFFHFGYPIRHLKISSKLDRFFLMPFFQATMLQILKQPQRAMGHQPQRPQRAMEHLLQAVTVPRQPQIVTELQTTNMKTAYHPMAKESEFYKLYYLLFLLLLNNLSHC